MGPLKLLASSQQVNKKMGDSIGSSQCFRTRPRPTRLKLASGLGFLWRRGKRAGRLESGGLARQLTGAPWRRVAGADATGAVARSLRARARLTPRTIDIKSTC